MERTGHLIMLSAGTLTVLPCVEDTGRCSKKVDPHEPALPSLFFGLDRGVIYIM